MVALDGLFERSMLRAEVKKVASPRSEEYVILNCIYLKTFTAMDQLSIDRFDVEHIAPKEQMRKLIEACNGDGLPISCIANLCYLPEYVNRSKKDKNFYQDKKYLLHVNLDEVESKYSFTEEADLEWMDMPYTENDFPVLKEYYTDYCTRRFDKIKHLLCNSLGIAYEEIEDTSQEITKKVITPVSEPKQQSKKVNFADKCVLRLAKSLDSELVNGSFWEETAPKSQGISQELTERQLEEAEAEIKKAMNEMNKNGAMEILVAMEPKKAANAFNRQQAHSFEMYENALNYKKYAIKRRDSKYIASALKEARPMLEIEQRFLDADEFLLNCPSGTIDLRKGIRSLRDHDPEDFITKQTAVDPGKDGADIWQDALNTFFQNDAALIDYVQKIVGLSAVGKVYVEALIIAYGEGRNGKSTFWNVVSRVLGTYSGNISADMLTVGCRRNVKPELAEAKGKRLLIAAELEEGMRLNTSNVKQLCSTDEIYAEKKYKDPFSYVPTHTLVLYTNHLPKVGAIDKGTWRRLIVIPFGAKIEGSSDIKNYADYLFEKAGGAILSWVIEGAKKVIADDFHITAPQKVQEAIDAYKENNDWMSAFLNERCEIDDTAVVKSGELYNEYRSFCLQVGEYVRSSADFYTAVESFGFERFRNRNGRFVKGLKLKTEFE